LSGNSTNKLSLISKNHDLNQIYTLVDKAYYVDQIKYKVGEQ